LFRAVIRDTVEPSIEKLQAIMAVDLPFPDLVRAFLARFADMTSRVPVGAVAKMVIGESRNFPKLAKVWHDQVASRALAILTTLIAKAQERGEVRSGDPRLYAFTLVGPMLMGVLWRETMQPIGADPLDLAELARQHSETVLSGLLTPSAK
jgi:hypothetical protein